MDPLPSSKSKEDRLPLVQYNQDHAVSGDDLENAGDRGKKKSIRDKGSSDSVRIMQKVLGGCGADSCLYALDATDWDIHRAIKLVKLRNLVKAPGILTDSDLRVALQTRDWDVAKAASVLMKKIKE